MRLLLAQLTPYQTQSHSGVFLSAPDSGASIINIRADSNPVIYSCNQIELTADADIGSSSKNIIIFDSYHLITSSGNDTFINNVYSDANTFYVLNSEAGGDYNLTTNSNVTLHSDGYSPVITAGGNVIINSAGAILTDATYSIDIVGDIIDLDAVNNIGSSTDPIELDPTTSYTCNSSSGSVFCHPN
jgi:hypothetical protein